ncbi:ArsR/SmtB family transcription factor [Nannocystaceae bacterium ST9]
MPANAPTERMVFRAIADPSRRRILDRLWSSGECAALDLGEGLEASQPALSKHLKVLRDAGLVRVRRSGRHQLYAMNPVPLREVVDWIEKYRRFWDERLDALGRYLDSEAHDEPEDEAT